MKNQPRSSAVEQSLDKRSARGSNPRGATNRQKGRGLNTGSRPWRNLRDVVLRRDLYTCKHCGRYGNNVDHINNDSHDNRIENLQVLCWSCHSVKTGQEAGGGQSRPKVEVGVDGAPEGW